MNSTLLTCDPDTICGVPCFAGRRVPVQHLFDHLQGESSLVEFLVDFPSVSRAHAISVLEAAKNRLLADAPVA